MKQTDLEIIDCLRQGRISISEMARKLKMPISTVRDRIKNIEEKFVVKHSSLLDYSKLGYSSNAILAVKISPKEKKDFLKFLKRQSCVNSIYHINSGFNFLIELVCKDNFALRNWIEEIKSAYFLEIILFQILKTEEKEKFIPKNG